MKYTSSKYWFPAATFILGGIVAGIVGFLSRPTKPLPRPPSAAWCFLDPETTNPPLAQFDGRAITKDNLPHDLMWEQVRTEGDARRRLQALAEQTAVRMAARGDSPESAPVPSLAEVFKNTSVTDKDVEDYFNANKQSFAAIDFATAAPLIRNMLNQQQERLGLTTLIAPLRRDNRLQILHPIPCGPRISLPYDDNIPGQGNTVSGLALTLFYSYDCPLCGEIDRVLDPMVKRHLSRFRTWYIPVPGKTGTRSDWLAKGAQCAFRQGVDAFRSFHVAARELPWTHTEAEQPADAEFALDTARKSGIDLAGFESCLIDPATGERTAKYGELAESLNMTRPPALFFNNRLLDPGLGTDVGNTIQTILDEAERLRPYLK